MASPEEDRMSSNSSTERKHQAGAFDIRNIIGGLIGVYGVILTLMGIFGDPETDKTGGPNANLWAGLIMLLVGIGFLVWARLRPVLVPEHTDKDDLP
jgi:hypothetical protein